MNATHPAERQPRRVAVLYSHLSGYLAACLRELRHQHDVSLLVMHYEPEANAPFDVTSFIDGCQTHPRGDMSKDAILRLLNDWKPDLVLVAGWVDRTYLSVARALRRRGILVVAGLDAQWRGTLRQWVGRAIAPRFLHTAFDVLWVAGERQADFADKLGYAGPRCWHGLYCCDWEAFSTITRTHQTDPAFLYVGRYVPEKGIDTLLEAYRMYREANPTPWRLTCIGTGPLATRVAACEGATDVGFVQPAQLPFWLGRAEAFVMPSTYEPWGVALQEAGASALPLLASTACGAVTHVLQDGYNGYLFRSGDARVLAHRMGQIARLTPARRAQFGARSRMLAEQFTPRRWADTLVAGYQDLAAQKRGVDMRDVISRASEDCE